MNFLLKVVSSVTQNLLFFNLNRVTRDGNIAETFVQVNVTMSTLWAEWLNEKCYNDVVLFVWVLRNNKLSYIKLCRSSRSWQIDFSLIKKQDCNLLGNSATEEISRSKPLIKILLNAYILLFIIIYLLDARKIWWFWF